MEKKDEKSLNIGVGRAILGAIIGGLVGYLSANYFPIFGGFLITAVAEPFSEARMSLVPQHMLLFAFVFGIIGFLVGRSNGGAK